jgi:hypothetical protein
MSTSVFSDRTAVIVTQHGKEQVMAPILTGRLQLSCVVNNAFDTDQLGCFTGEIRRDQDVQAVLRKKCMAGIADGNFDIAIASEGSFYPHPQIWIRPCNEERIMILDITNGIEITAHTTSLETNHAAKEIFHWEELRQFALAAGFPAHGLILRPGTEKYDYQMKGIRDLNRLTETYHHLISRYGSVYAETDMRAHFNPSRMKVIEATTHVLCDKVLSLCPVCSWPGFSPTAYQTGLPCSECDYPTQSIRSVNYTCSHCHYSKEEHFPKGKKVEDPQYCDQCNP